MGTSSANSRQQPSNFSFSNQFMSGTSFSDLLTGDYQSSAGGGVSRGGLSDRIAERNGSGIPKFKSITPPSLPLSPPPVSPSSYFAIPPGLSPAELLDSPVLFSSSNILPSPTTGTFPSQGFNWKPSNNNQQQQGIKQEQKNFSDFSFHSQTRPPTTSFLSQIPTQENQSEFTSMPQSFSPEISTIQTNTQTNSGFQSEYSNGHYNQPSQSIREQQRRSEDGYNWRKYGQKQVKGSENPRSYYKCTFPNCPTKKKVERSLDGQITEIVYKGNHTHPKPQSTRRSSSAAAAAAAAASQAIQNCNHSTSEIPDQSYASHGTGQMDSATPENSSVSIGDDDFDGSPRKSKSGGGGGDEFDDEEPEAKRWKIEGESEGISAAGSRTVREPRVVVQTTSDIDILDDGYRWRKYGQKVVKGNPNPRSYYKCTSPGCPVRKHVERASHDLRAVITTYEGKHNHDVPAARGSGNHSINRPLPNTITTTNTATAIRPSAMFHHQSSTAATNPIRNSRLQQSDSQAPFTLEMLQSPGSFGFSGFGNSMGSNYMNQPIEFSRAKDEPRDELFVGSFLS